MADDQVHGVMSNCSSATGYLMWQNEETAHLPDVVVKRSIAKLIGVASEAGD